MASKIAVQACLVGSSSSSVGSAWRGDDSQLQDWTTLKAFWFGILLFLSSMTLAQNVRYSVEFPSVSPGFPPYLIANIPPTSPRIAVCSSPANALPCTNYATTYTSLGVACSNGAQDTPDPQPSACQTTGDAQGNIGFWIPPGKYDYTVCVSTSCFGPYTITLSSLGSATGVSSISATSPITTNPSPISTSGSVGLSTACLNTVWEWNGSTWGCVSTGGSIGSGVQYQMAIYPVTGSSVSGDTKLTDNGTTLSYGGAAVNIGGTPITVCGTAAACIGIASGTLGSAGSIAGQGAILLDSGTSKWNVVLPSGSPFVSSMNYPVTGTGSLTSVLGGPSQYTKLRCESGLGDGLNAMAAGTYLQFMCVNDSGVTWTITAIHCWTDNAGTSTLNAANNASTALLTGAVTCNNTKASGGAAGTQSGTTTLASGDAVSFTFVSDGTSKQTTWTVSLTQ